MKVTSYEISKKLAEIGFTADDPAKIWSERWNCQKKKREWILSDNYDDEDKVNPQIPAFDLETILEALPDYYDCVNDGGGLFFSMTKFFIGYVCCPDGDIHEETIEVQSRGEESRADTAARLLILLHEKGLIKFGEENVG